MSERRGAVTDGEINVLASLYEIRILKAQQVESAQQALQRAEANFAEGKRLVLESCGWSADEADINFATKQIEPRSKE